VLRVTAAAAACLTLAVPSGHVGRMATDRQSWTIALPAGRSLGLDLTIGTVRIQGESRTDAAVEAVRTAPSDAALSRIPVTVDERDHEVRITALQADAGTDPAYRSDLTIRVPRDASLRALRLMEGRLIVTAITGRLEAAVQRGPIEASDVQGTIRLETTIGDITAARARLSPNGLLRLRTFNGNVELTLAERPADARILALALNGTIHSDIPLTTKDTWGPRWAEATLGKGEPVISIDVVTGRIHIRTASR
jgi:hypothetical protein